MLLSAQIRGCDAYKPRQTGRGGGGGSVCAVNRLMSIYSDPTLVTC